MGEHIVVVGSCMMDLVVRAPRHPQPGETLLGHSFATFIGGKGLNQAVAAKRAGGRQTFLISSVGADAFGSEIRAYLEHEGVDTRFVSTNEHVGTGVAVPLVYDDGTNTILAVPRANLAMTAADVEAAADVIRTAAVLLVNFEVAMEAVVAAMRIAAQANVPAILNPAPIASFPGELRGLPTVVIANELEAAALSRATSAEFADQAAGFIEGRTRVAVVTLGKRGAVWCDEDLQEAGHIRAFPVQAIDSVGAGDAFCGAFAVALAEGLPVDGAMMFASAAGALATTVAGAAPSLPGRPAIDDLLLPQ